MTSPQIIESVPVPRAASFHTVRLIQRTQRKWYIGLPNGCTLFVGNGGKRETLEQWEQTKAACLDGTFSWPSVQN